MKKRNIALFLSFASKSWKYFLTGMAATLGMILCDMLIPQVIRTSIDALTIQEGEAASYYTSWPSWIRNAFERAGGYEWLAAHLAAAGILIVVIAACGAFFRWLSTWENARGGESLTKTMQDELYARIARLPYSWHVTHAAGDIIQRCTSDVTMIKEFCSVQLYDLVRIILLVIFALYFMSSMHLRLMFAALAFFPLIVTYSLIFHNRIGTQFTACDENEGILSTIAQENLTGVRVVRAFGKEAAEEEKFRSQNRIYTNLWMKLCASLAWFWALGDLASGLQVLTVVLLGALFCVQGSLSLGGYIAFISYNNMLVWPIRALGRMLSEMSKSEVSLTRIADIMNASEEQETVLPALDHDPDDLSIRFRHVSFSFDEKQVLRDIDFYVNPGDTIGILGSTGCGKSTLMHLLCRLYELPEENGSIEIGGTDIRRIPLPKLRRMIGIVLQEPFLFSRTIGENIGIGGNCTEEEIERVIRIASLSDTISDFPKGLDTIVGERGVTLSGGQRQRIAIARMLTEHAPIMIYDDSLSAVDAGTDVKIRKALQEQLGESTVFLISHRISTLMHANQIYVMEDGVILEHGTHSELLAMDGTYARIFRMQSALEEVGEE